MAAGAASGSQHTGSGSAGGSFNLTSCAIAHSINLSTKEDSMTTSDNPFELLTDDKHEANVMRISAYMAMLLAKAIERHGRPKSAELLGVSVSRVSRLANRTGSGMTIDFMLLSLSKLGAEVNADMLAGEGGPVNGARVIVTI